MTPYTHKEKKIQQKPTYVVCNNEIHCDKTGKELFMILCSFNLSSSGLQSKMLTIIINPFYVNWEVAYLDLRILLVFIWQICRNYYWQSSPRRKRKCCIQLQSYPSLMNCHSVLRKMKGRTKDNICQHTFSKFWNSVLLFDIFVISWRVFTQIHYGYRALDWS